MRCGGKFPRCAKMSAKHSKKSAKATPPGAGAVPAPVPAVAGPASPAPASNSPATAAFTPWIESTDPRRRTIGKIVLVGVWLYVAALWLLALDQTFNWGIFGPKPPPLP